MVIKSIIQIGNPIISRKSKVVSSIKSKETQKIIKDLEDGKIDRKEFSDRLAKILEQTCDNQNSDISEGNLKGYKTLFQQKPEDGNARG